MGEQIFTGSYPRREIAKPPRKPFSRRSFLKAGAFTAATLGAFKVGLVTGEAGAKQIFGIANAEPKVAKYQLLAEDQLIGRFNPDKYRPVASLGDALAALREKVDHEEERTGSKLTGLQVMAFDRSTGALEQLVRGDVRPDYAVASVAKVPVCWSAIEEGKRDGTTYLTPELAEKILRFSSNDHLDRLVRSLPVSNGAANYDAYRKIMTEVGVPPASHHAPLRVRMTDMLKFFATKPSFPEPMRTALTPRIADSPLTYGVTDITERFKQSLPHGSDNEEPEDVPTHFKIGLISTPLTEDSGSDVPHVGWWLRFGDTDVVGNATGGEYSARLAMLHAVGSVSRYELGKKA